MRTFALLVRAGFRRHTTYRLALVAGLTTNAVFGLIRASVLTAAIVSAGAPIAGYDTATALAFVWWGQALLGTIRLWGVQDIGERVRSGDVAVDFLRPLDPQVAALATDLGRAAVNLVARGLPCLLIGAILYDIAWPPGPGAWLVGLLAVLLGTVAAFAGAFIIELISFWVVEIRGIRLLWQIVAGLFSGLYVPVPWFPDWIRVIADASPFPSMLQHPVDILAGRLVGTEALSAVATQVFWVVVLLGTGQWMLRAGRRHLEVQGG